MTAAMIACIILLLALFLVGVLPGLPGHRVWKDHPIMMTASALVLFGFMVLFGVLR